MKNRSKLLGKILFLFYIVFLFYFLIFSDWYGRTGVREEYHYNFILFQEIGRYWRHREQLGMISFFNLVGNVAIFVPFGFFMSMASYRRRFLNVTCHGFLTSLLVEVFQLISRVGSFDVDDILLNTVGAVIGYIAFVICDMIRRKYGKRKR